MTFARFTGASPLRRLTSPLKLTVGLLITIAGPAMALAGGH